MSKLLPLILGIVIISVSGALFVSAEQDEDREDFEDQLLEWEEQGIDPNHMDVIEEIKSYMEQNISAEPSLHIDREERDLGNIIISTTSPLEEEHKEAMRKLTEEPAEIAFREVAFREEELQNKQAEIDMNSFEDEDINIHHTSVSITDNIVEVGIEPFNAKNAQLVYEEYGEDRIEVVEGHEATTLDTENSSDEMVENEQDQSNHMNFIQRVSNWFTSLF